MDDADPHPAPAARVWALRSRRRHWPQCLVFVLAACSRAQDDAAHPGAVASSTLAPRSTVGVLPQDVRYAPSPLVDGATNAVVLGDPTADGLYLLLGQMEQGVVFPTHTHPDDRLTTVITGTMYYSTEPLFDPSDVVAYPAGSVVMTPAGTPHTMWAKDGAIVVQEAGAGPTGLTPTEPDGAATTTPAQ